MAKNTKGGVRVATTFREQAKQERGNPILSAEPPEKEGLSKTWVKKDHKATAGWEPQENKLEAKSVLDPLHQGAKEWLALGRYISSKSVTCPSFGDR